MSNKTKDLILKALLVIDVFLFLLFFPGSIVIDYLVHDQKTFDVIYLTLFLIANGVGILFMILLPIFGGLKPKSVKAKKVPLTFASYDEFFDFLQKRLSQKDYKLQEAAYISSNGELALYLKQQKVLTLACFTIIRVTELSDDLLNNANKIITDILNEYYGCKIITDKVDMISVFCVDLVTPAFRKLVNSNVQQGFKNGRFLVGVSFGGKNIYVATQRGGFAITKYKRLKKEFTDIMNLQIK